MSRRLFIINSEAMRQRLCNYIVKLPYGWRVEFKENKRSTEQNSRLWANLTDVAMQCTHHGIKLTPEDWKLLFISCLFKAQAERMRLVPNLDGDGFVALGGRSSDLTVSEMRDLITLIEEYGARNGVVFHDKEGKAA